MFTDQKSFDGVIFNYFQPLKAALSHQHLKVSVYSLWPLLQQHGSKSSNLANNPLTGSTSRLNPKDKAVSEDKCKEVSMHIPSTIIQSHVLNEGKLKVLLSSVQDALSKMPQCNPGSQVIWGQGDEVQVRHQKQTSSQLLCFLKEKAKTKGSLEVTVLESPESPYKGNHTASPLRTSPTVKTEGYPCRHVTKGVADERAPQTLHENVNQAPIFRVKTVPSCGSLIYSCVIATENELWDVGDIFTEVLFGEYLHCTPSENEKHLKPFAQVENCINLELKSRTLQRTKPENNSVHSDYLAPDTVNIPEFGIRKFEETEVVVSHVVSPSNFYIQHADAPKKLKALFTEYVMGSVICMLKSFFVYSF